METGTVSGIDPLADGRKKLEDGRKELDDGWAAVQDAEQQLKDAKEQLDSGGTALVEAEYQLAAIPGYLINAMAILDEIEGVTGTVSLPGAAGGLRQQFRDSIQRYGDSRMLWYSKGEEYLDALALLEQNRKRLDEGEAEYDEACRQIEENEKKFSEGDQQFKDGEEAIRDGEKKLEDAEKELADAEKRVRDGKEKLSDAEELRDKLGLCQWITLNDRGNAGYIYNKSNSDNLSSLSMSFSLIFLVVGALVIYATIVRMMEEQRQLIGTTKALGFYNHEILIKYLIFGGSAAAVGVGLGILLAAIPLLITFGFSAVINVFALRRIKDLKLSDLK